ncbi:hypothetical protein PC121_g9457 [Phytophthora cactorum]|nr:hypothetical protein PC120_g13268 [Phytophthora cactorum]KAG3070645.1 hypothetical protein PC121_g9457 [Phytophthora cactorum]
MLDEEGDLTGYHVCKACGKRRKHAPNNGYTNLVTHVRTAHPSFERYIRDATTAATGTVIAWVSQKASNRYGWLKWVIMGNLPLSFCESQETRHRYSNLASVSVDALLSNMEGVTKVVEITIGKEMPVDFGLILDDCSFGTEQYQGVYGCYETPSGPQYPLLSMAPVMDEPGDHLTAEGHLMEIERFLPFFGKTIQGVKFLVGDNCAVNKRLAKLMKVPLVGCASHRLNLAVRDFLRPHESALEEVQQLMRKQRTLNQAAKLRVKTPLVSVLRQDTRWSSTFSMLDRYFRLREFLSADDEDIADLLPSRSVHRKLEDLLSKLRFVESISKKLQSDGLTLLDARYLFDGLLEQRPSFSNYLSLYADIVHSPTFEAAVVKVPAGDSALLTAEEAEELEPFKVAAESSISTETVSSTAKEGFADRILKRRKVAAEPSTYKLLSAIPPTSNVVERLFSVARGVLRHERRRISPMTLEMILFLKVNASYWNVATVEASL